MISAVFPISIFHLKTENSLVEKARTAAMERMVIFSRDSCFSTLNLPNTGVWITPLATVIFSEKQRSEEDDSYKIELSYYNIVKHNKIQKY